jgi:hypothetical protein
VKFKKNIEGTPDNWFEEIQIIEDINKVEDIIKWFKNFEDLANANKWSKQVQDNILQRLI